MNNLFHDYTSKEFEAQALTVFAFQYQNNAVYQEFCNYFNKTPKTVHTLKEIPFLPIEFFKNKEVYAATNPPEEVFTSSGTTGSQTSRHLVSSLTLYRESFRKGFAHFYGEIGSYIFLALLPSYLERKGSSLIYMADDLIHNAQKESGFYLYNQEELAQKLILWDAKGHKVFLMGVSFALLDLVEQYQFSLKNTIIMETGGMKGRRKELIREELHSILCQGFGTEVIHSEYGMTELLSQAYSQGNGLFAPVPWMKILIRDSEDALSFLPYGKIGGINVIDLANYYSCSFIATQDLGKAYPDGTFEVLGRFDSSDIRGCNLLVLQN
ncbi:acyl transferase [uncultured Capnocytophaga sp.]|uniref:LuxE/PaaK family acyltransferase n=1 Tax=uncultured Capnocytophaga sp. TaxID=159273 RepID=UPI00260799BA|nr:acyl transferase [uncultured Capnocytophaga sp.]